MKKSIDRIEKRIQKLESQNRILVLVCVLGLSLLAVSMTSSDNSKKTVRAQQFVLVDSTGAVRGELSMRDGAPGFYLKDEAGTDRVVLTHEADQTALYLLDAQGDTRVGAAQFSHGGGGFALHGPEGKGAAVLYLKKSGSLRLFDEEGTVTAQFPEPVEK